jgi:hypothetical protein
MIGDFEQAGEKGRTPIFSSPDLPLVGNSGGETFADLS